MILPQKRHSFDKAKLLLASGDKESLRYCALELRTCIELICYERMSMYTDELSPAHLRQWRPSDVVELLLQCDPDSDQDCTISLAREMPGETTGPRNVLGSSRGVTKRFVNEHYHRLGSHLHAPTLADIKAGTSNMPDEIKASFQKTIDALEPFINRSNVLSNFGDFRTFVCDLCGSKNKRNVSAFTEGCTIACIGPKCPALYQVMNVGTDALSFALLRKGWLCTRCKAENQVYPWDIEPRKEYACASCKAKHEVYFALRLIEDPQH